MHGALVIRRAAGAMIAVAAALLLAASPASAAQSALAAGPYAAVTGFANPAVVLFEGDSLSLTNFDVSAHSVEAKARDRLEPLFASPDATIGESVPVTGVEDLAPGTYDFVCRLHPWMTGTVTVLAR